MKLQDLVLQQARPMPVFLLIDSSGSMGGEKIAAVNAALRDMLSTFKNLDDIRGEIHLCLITFGGEVTIVQPLTPVSEVTLPFIEAAGKTPMGRTFNIVRDLIEDKNVVPSRAYTPTIVLISDGCPTDIEGTDPLFEKVVNEEATQNDYLSWAPIQELHKAERTRKSAKLALGIGEEADQEMLKAFVNDATKPVLRVKNVSGISRFFQWVTMSVSARSVSANPNMEVSIPYEELFDTNELI